MLGALGSPMPCCAYPHCAVKVGEAAMKFRGLPSCQFLPALNYLLSLEAGRGENQCTEQKFYLQRSSRPGVVARHEGSAAAVSKAFSATDFRLVPASSVPHRVPSGLGRQVPRRAQRAGHACGAALCQQGTVKVGEVVVELWIFRQAQLPVPACFGA